MIISRSTLTTEILFVRQIFFPEKAADIKESRILNLHKAKRKGDRPQLVVKVGTIEKRSQVRSARSIWPQSRLEKGPAVKLLITSQPRNFVFAP
jgi:hypothetical protein